MQRHYDDVAECRKTFTKVVMLVNDYPDHVCNAAVLFEREVRVKMHTSNYLNVDLGRELTGVCCQIHPSRPSEKVERSNSSLSTAPCLFYADVRSMMMPLKVGTLAQLDAMTKRVDKRLKVITERREHFAAKQAEAEAAKSKGKKRSRQTADDNTGSAGGAGSGGGAGAGKSGGKAGGKRAPITQFVWPSLIPPLICQHFYL